MKFRNLSLPIIATVTALNLASRAQAHEGDDHFVCRKGDKVIHTQGDNDEAKKKDYEKEEIKTILDAYLAESIASE